MENQNKKPRVIDLDDYDLTLDIHGDPIRNPPKPHDYKNDDGEYEYIADAYWIAGGVIRKDAPRDYSKYMQMCNEFQQTDVYKRKQAAWERYKERLKTCKTKEDNFKALMDYKKEKNDNT
jgi:hypothetical protein